MMDSSSIVASPAIYDPNGKRMKTILFALAALPLAIGCVSGAPQLSAEQQSRVAKMSLYKPGEDPPGRYRVLESISAADCSGAPAGGRVWGDAEQAIETLKAKAAALDADAGSMCVARRFRC
jgi:hypothetical protein